MELQTDLESPQSQDYISKFTPPMDLRTDLECRQGWDGIKIYTPYGTLN